MIRAEEYYLLECESQIKEVVAAIGSGLVDLSTKGALFGKLLTLSRN